MLLGVEFYDAWKYVQDSFRRMFLLNLQKELKQEKNRFNGEVLL